MNEYIVYLDKFAHRHRHTPKEEILIGDWQFVFFRNQNLFSSHSRNTKYQGTHEAPEFYFYTHNFKKNLNRFSPNLVLKKKCCSGTANVSAKFQSTAFLQLSWQVFKEVLSKQKPSRTEKKKKETPHLPYH